MFKKRSQFFQSLLLVFDLAIIAAAWIAAYELRRSGWPIPLYDDIPPPLHNYLFLLLFIPMIWSLIFKYMDIYRPRHIGDWSNELYDILKASTTACLIYIVAAYFLKKFEVSRLVFVYFWAISSFGVACMHLCFRHILRVWYRRGYNLHHVVIVGTECFGQDLCQKIIQQNELGLNVVGFVTCHRHEVGQRLHGVEIVGHIDAIQAIVQARAIDQVVIALPLEAHTTLEKTLLQLDNELVDIRIVLDLASYLALHWNVDSFEGLPIVTLRESPMYGWPGVLKRAFDLCASGLLLLGCAPLFGVISGLIKLTSEGPVFYQQERMMIDGHIFHMIKFRTMQVDAERQTGAVWAQPNDQRRTRFGAFLRRLSLDELPQLWNVLKGDMSLVGPRPERPVFVQQFHQRLPRYMLRHRVKSGITGWAQVHGWRGNTSIEKRLEYDLYYVKHWSLGLDLQILWLTLWRGFMNKNAY